MTKRCEQFSQKWLPNFGKIILFYAFAFNARICDVFNGVERIHIVDEKYRNRILEMALWVYTVNEIEFYFER